MTRRENQSLNKSSLSNKKNNREKEEPSNKRRKMRDFKNSNSKCKRNLNKSNKNRKENGQSYRKILMILMTMMNLSLWQIRKESAEEHLVKMAVLRKQKTEDLRKIDNLQKNRENVKSSICRILRREIML